MISKGDDGSPTGCKTATTLNETSTRDIEHKTATSKPWKTNQWVGWTLRVLGGTGAGQDRIVTSNSATQLTLSSPWSTIPDTSSTYEMGFSTPDGIAPPPGNNLYVCDEPAGYSRPH